MGCTANVRGVEIDRVTGVIPSGVFEGQAFVMVRYQETTRPVEYVRLTIGQEFNRAFRYSGRNLAAAAEQLAEMRAALK